MSVDESDVLKIVQPSAAEYSICSGVKTQTRWPGQASSCDSDNLSVSASDLIGLEPYWSSKLD